jgi:hypothetical protein
MAEAVGVDMCVLIRKGGSELIDLAVCFVDSTIFGRSEYTMVFSS